MQNIIKEHRKRYPEMELRDVFKLIYQSEFGGGHMIEDKQKSLEWIKEEYEFMNSQNWPVREQICEDIGGDMCRIYLDALGQGLSEETLNEIFVASANEKKGTIEGLEEKLAMFLENCKENPNAKYFYAEAEKMVDEWKAKGYPAIHHSEVYRSNYFPVYRVVRKKYAERLGVLKKIDKRLREYRKENTGVQRPFVIAIDGMAGSGKSVLGRLLQEIYHCNLFHMDDFFLQPYQRTPERFAEPGGNVDYERFKEEVLDQIENTEGFRYRKYDCSTQSLLPEEYAAYKELVVIEGAYSLHPYFQERADLAFFLGIPDELQKERIRKRNGEWMLKRFVEEWIPMEHKYFEAFGIKEKATQI